MSTTALPARFARRARLTSPVAWGVGWAVIALATMLLITPEHWTIQGGRAQLLGWMLEGLRHGKPLLTGIGPGGTLVPAGANGDDEGLYLFVPVLSHLLGDTNPVDTLRWVCMLGWCLTVALSAVVFDRLLGRTAMLVAAPCVWFLACGFFWIGDLYWVAPWGILTLLPLIMLVGRGRLTAPRLLALAAMMVVASALDTVRSGVAAGILVAAIVVVVMRRPSWRVAALAVVVLAGSYVSVSTIGMDALRAHRDAELHRHLSARNGHVVWHSAYIGLGYTANRYGIHYSDTSGALAAQRERPGVQYLSPEYERVLRTLYFRVVRNDPLFFASVTAKKFVVMLGLAAPFLLLLLLTLLPLRTFGAHWREIRGLGWLVLPAVVLGTIPCLAVIPEWNYEEGVFGSLGLLAILGLCGIALELERGPAAMAARFRAAWQRSRILRRGIPAGVAVIAVLVALTVVFRHQHTVWGMGPTGASQAVGKRG